MVDLQIFAKIPGLVCYSFENLFPQYFSSFYTKDAKVIDMTVRDEFEILCGGGIFLSGNL